MVAEFMPSAAFSTDTVESWLVRGVRARFNGLFGRLATHRARRVARAVGEGRQKLFAEIPREDCLRASLHGRSVQRSLP